MTPVDERVYSLGLVQRRWLSKKTFELSFERPPAFDFKAGQRIRFFHEGFERDYSLANAPVDPALVLCIRRVATGGFSSLLSTATSGTQFTISGPHGYFTYQPSPRQAVFVASGTGVAPFCSMIRSGVGGCILLHGVGQKTELYYSEELQKASTRYVACLSNEKDLPRDAFQGRVTDYLRQHLPVQAYDFYLCGRSEMIRDATLLIDNRFSGSHIYTEIFY
jgi:ferredoxin-NADP reductase